MEAVKLASPALLQVINDLQALRGIADISAVTIAAELGQVSRFSSAREPMGCCSAVPSEDSSGKRTRRGGLTKTGNAHLRRIVVEAPGAIVGHRVFCTDCADDSRASPRRRKRLRWKAQHRLHERYMKLGADGKDQRKIVTAVARELPGFIWALKPEQRRSPASELQPEKNHRKDETPKNEKARTTQSMNGATHLEHSASSNRGKHEREPSFGLCDRPSRTRANSQRQIPTDHDYAVPTREYQTDQSSLKPAPTAARSVLGKLQKQRQKQPHRFAAVDTVTPKQAKSRASPEDTPRTNPRAAFPEDKPGGKPSAPPEHSPRLKPAGRLSETGQISRPPSRQPRETRLAEKQAWC